MEPWTLAVVLLAGVGLLLIGAAVKISHLLQPLRIRGVPVFRYRAVGPPQPGSAINDLRVPLSRFEAQIRHLSRRGFQAVTLDEALERRYEQSFLDSNPLALTFDGPYRSFASVVWPTLKRHGFQRATLFFPLPCLNQSVMPALDGAPEPVLSSRVLAELAQDGVSVGLQGVLSEGVDPEKLEEQFRAGREALGKVCGQKIELLSIPFRDPDAMAAAKRAGFRGVALLGEGILNGKTKEEQISRFAMHPTSTLLDLALVVSHRVGKMRW